MSQFQLSLAPQKLWQAINPWTFYQQGAQFGFINIDLGLTPRPEAEQAVLDEVGSYGRQLGRIGDALEVLLDHVKLDGLSKPEKDALDALRGQLASVRRVKQRTGATKGSSESTPKAVSSSNRVGTSAR
jgi:hypothetical protein